MESIADHTISRISLSRHTRRYPRPIGWNAKVGPHGQTQEVTACRIDTDQGASGWGFSGVTQEDADRFVGRALTDLFGKNGTVLEARAIDVPLHDLVAKILGQPVWRMLGGVGGREIPIYTGAIYFDDLNPKGDDPGVQAILDSCAQDTGAGHAHFKLKIGRGFKWMEKSEGDARDIEVTRLVREHYPDAQLLVDANDGYDPEGICRYLEQVADCDLYWIEEPFTETEEGLKLLRDKMNDVSPKTIVADGEARPPERLQDPPGPFGKWRADHLEELYALAESGLIEVLLMDVGATGFTAWRNIIPRLEAIGAQGSPHAWSEPFKSWHAAQIGCGLGSVPIIEGVPASVDGIDDSEYVIENGTLTLPESPGFGMHLIDQ